MTASPFSLPITVRERTIAGAPEWATTSALYGADGKFYFAIPSPHHAEYAAAIARAVNGQAKMMEALEPFAKEADRFASKPWQKIDDNALIRFSVKPLTDLTVGNLRAAARALIAPQESR